jgi:uncharacterized protein YkwD
MLGGATRTTLALLLGAAALAASGTAATGKRATAVNTLSRDVLVQVNVLRRTKGLVPLKLASGLNAAALQHSREMATDGYFAHESVDGSSFDKRVARFYRPGSFRYWSVGENLVWSAPTLDAAGALTLWLNSPPHRKNLLDPHWREIGIAAVHVTAAPGAYGGGAATIVTADFGVRH